jgi:nitrogen fixation protein FixH
MNSTSTAQKDSGSAWRSPWVFGWIGLIVVVLAVNAVMIGLAFYTKPALVRADYYESGRAIERSIITRLEEGPNWTMKIDAPSHVQPDVPVTLRFIVVDQVGQPATPDAVTFYAYRPSDADLDFVRPMVQEAPGRYAAQVVFPLGGVWDTLVEARNADDAYSLSKRVSVDQP